ncbi:MAG: phosphoribosylformylglycinamidine cyclo-ligase [Phycisphaeraceae bacterium]|nr:phosphoribosylformylglycinamidine cyclo-ligase [Phycisphaeraceae bacterium]
MPAKAKRSEDRGLSYAEAGVDIDAGDRAADLILSHLRRTHGPRVIANPGGFAGLFRLDFNEHLFKKNYRDPVLVACTDGVGTKVKLAAQLGIHDTVGIDLVAMSVNDMLVQGAEPLIFLDYIGVHRVDPEVIERIVKGVADGCEQAGCALLGGETAEMPDVYALGDYDLAGFAVGVVELRRAVNAERVSPGDVVLGLASSGVHSNGFSLVRRIVSHAKLDLGRVYADLDPSRTLGEVLLTPTRIYTRSVGRVLRTYRVKSVVTGMAHITGGGLAGNLARSIGPECDAVLRRSAWEAPPVFEFLRRHGRVDPEEMDRVFNMGVGYCLVVRPTFADAISRRLERAGERVFRLGRIARGKGRVRLT